MSGRTKTYFASDFHLGAPNQKESHIREKKICAWLEQISIDAKEIYLLGDLFDFWFEYKKVIPKGFERLKGKLANLTDSGIIIHLFVGNHDLWTFGYLEAELGLKIYRKPCIVNINNKKIYIAHGDGLGKGNATYKFIKGIYENCICQWFFKILPSNLGVSLAQFLSRTNKRKQHDSREKIGEAHLIEYSKNILKTQHIDFFIYGHIHRPCNVEIGTNSRYINLGDWVNHFSYAELERENLLLKKF